MPDPFPDIPLKLSAKVFIKNGQCVKELVEYIKSIPEYAALKNDPQILEYVISVIENVASKKTTQDQKIENIIKVYTQVFGNIEVETLKKQIKYFYDNQLVQRHSLIRRICRFFLKKLPKL